MYFTSDPSLQRLEKEMQGVPNFGRREVWEKCESCESCVNFEKSFSTCRKAKCPDISKKIAKSQVTTAELIKTVLHRYLYYPFNERIKAILLNFKGDLRFKDEAHKKCFNEAVKAVSKSDKELLAAIYLLTIRPQIFESIVHTPKGFISLISDLSYRDRVLISLANAIRTGVKPLPLRGVSDNSYVSDREFICVCNALLIKSLGLAVVRG